MKLASFRPFLIPFIVLAVSCITISLVFPKTIREPLSSGYADCISSGYSKQFCVQTSSSAIGPAGCVCPNGNVGTIRPGFRGGCVCKDTL